eukprot:s3467_g1.t2
MCDISLDGSSPDAFDGSATVYEHAPDGKCIAAAIWAYNGDEHLDPDLQACEQRTCKFLVAAYKDSNFHTHPAIVNDCSYGPTHIDLTFNKATKVLGYEYWDNDNNHGDWVNTKIRWRLENTAAGSWDGVAQVPETNSAEGTGFQHIAGLLPAPENVVALRLTQDQTGGLRYLRLCRPKPVECTSDEEEVLFKPGGDARKLNQGDPLNSDYPGITFDTWLRSSLGRLEANFGDAFDGTTTHGRCIAAAIWAHKTEYPNLDVDLQACSENSPGDKGCKFLVAAESDSDFLANPIIIDDCDHNQGGLTHIDIKFDKPTKILTYEYWDNDGDWEKAKIRWRLENTPVGTWDGEAQIPQTSDEEGTGEQSIADISPIPENVVALRLTQGNTGGLRSLRLCVPKQGSSSSSSSSSTTEAPSASTSSSTTEAPSASTSSSTTEAPSASTSSSTTQVECPNQEFYDFDFRPGTGRLFNENDPLDDRELVPGSGIYFISFDKKNTPTSGSTTCLGAAMWTKPTSDPSDGDLIACGDTCRLLIDPSLPKIDDCKFGPTSIDLQLVPSRKILGFEFWDNDETSFEDTKFQWRNTGSTGWTTPGEFGEQGAPQTGDSQGTGFVNIAGNAYPPNDVEFVRTSVAFGH